MPLHVNPSDGSCRTCGGQLTITDADDATMTVACQACGAAYLVEPDAFNDGAVHYWPQVTFDQLKGGDSE